MRDLPSRDTTGAALIVCIVRAALSSLSVLWRPGAQHPEVPPAADLDPLTHGLLLDPRSRLRLHHRVRECFQVIGPVLERLHGQSHHIPTTRRGEPASVFFAQVVAVRLDIGRQRAEDRGGVTVHVGQRVDGRMLACGARAATRTHQPTSLTSP